MDIFYVKVADGTKIAKLQVLKQIILDYPDGSMQSITRVLEWEREKQKNQDQGDGINVKTTKHYRF